MLADAEIAALADADGSPRRSARRDRCARDRGSTPDVRLQSIEATLRDEPTGASWGEVFAPAWRRPLMVGLGLAVFQQITGINAIIYYSDKIFAAAGFASAQAQTQATTWAIGAVNVLATLIAIAFIDRLGRRPLLLAGLVGMFVSLTAVGFAFLSLDKGTGAASTVAGIVTLVALVVFIISFAFSLGPVVWTVINEIFPGRVRGRAVAVATAANWGAAFLVSEFFLTLVDAIGESATFWLFAFFCVVGGVWIYRQRARDQGALAGADRGAVVGAAPAGVATGAANRVARVLAVGNRTSLAAAGNVSVCSTSPVFVSCTNATSAGERPRSAGGVTATVVVASPSASTGYGPYSARTT